MKFIFLIKGKKAMEMWQLVFIILALMLLFFVFVFYGGMGDTIKELLDGLGKLM